MTRPLLLIGALFLSGKVLFAQDLGPSSGRICGKVLDETGHPAARVRVVAIYFGSTTGIQPGEATDQQGHYCITGLMFGQYTMSANDPPKGYPEMYHSFFAPHMPWHLVTLSYKKPNGHSDFQAPIKPAPLKLC